MFNQIAVQTGGSVFKRYRQFQWKMDISTELYDGVAISGKNEFHTQVFHAAVEECKAAIVACSEHRHVRIRNIM